VEWEDHLRAAEFASLAFSESVLKEHRMSETGVTTPRGKVITDEQGKPIRLEAGVGIAQRHLASGRKSWPRSLAGTGGWRTCRLTSKRGKMTFIPATAWSRARRKSRGDKGHAKVQYGYEKVPGSNSADHGRVNGASGSAKTGKAVYGIQKNDGSKSSMLKLRGLHERD